MGSCRLVADKMYEQISHIIVFGYFRSFCFYSHFICLCHGILSVFGELRGQGYDLILIASGDNACRLAVHLGGCDYSLVRRFPGNAYAVFLRRKGNVALDIVHVGNLKGICCPLYIPQHGQAVCFFLLVNSGDLIASHSEVIYLHVVEESAEVHILLVEGLSEIRLQILAQIGHADGYILLRGQLAVSIYGDAVRRDNQFDIHPGTAVVGIRSAGGGHLLAAPGIGSNCKFQVGRLDLQEEIVISVLADGKSEIVACSGHLVDVHRNGHAVHSVKESFREGQVAVMSAHAVRAVAVQIENLAVGIILRVNGAVRQYRVIFTCAVFCRSLGEVFIEVILKYRLCLGILSAYFHLHCDFRSAHSKLFIRKVQYRSAL